MFGFIKIIHFSVFILILSGALFAQKKDLIDYNNKGQSNAILSAQSSKEAFSLAQKNYFSSNIFEIRAYCDSIIVLSNKAIQYADSAILFTSDSCTYGKEIMLTAKANQLKTLGYCHQILNQNINESIHILSEKAMYSIGNAIVEAYEASLYFDCGSDERFDSIVDLEIEEPMIDCDNLIIDTVLSEEPREITRLEVDEVSYMTIKEVYGKRLAEIDDELSLLNEQAEKNSGDKLDQINEAIIQLDIEEEKCFQKMKNSEDRLVNVRNDLSREMLQVVHRDVFKTDKYGFYDENVPIPQDHEIPEGLVFKVQMAFFKNQLPPKYFDGIFPLLSQKVDNSYYRYVAGNFSKYIEASRAKSQVVEKGYSDSFVIAYFDGERISLCEAIEKENNSD